MTTDKKISLYEDELSVGKRQVERGTVRIVTSVTEREETAEQTLRSESAEVVRVPINRPVEALPETRREGDVLIVPVVEEELVVTKRLILKEELHIRMQASQRTERISVTLRSERAAVTHEEAAASPDHSRQEQTP